MAITHFKNPNPTNEDMIYAEYRYKKNRPNYRAIYNIDEIWKPILLSYIQPWYYVSTYGKIYSKLYDCLIRDRFIGRGYKVVTLRKSDNKPIDLLVHRLVLLTFSPISNPDDYQVNHIDTDKTNNHISNLEWCTNSENMIHAYKHNLYKNGENNNFAIIDNNTAHKICEALEQNLSYTQICVYAGLPISKRYKDIIYHIKTHRNWKHISSNYNF